MKMINELRVTFIANLVAMADNTNVFRGMILQEGRALGMTTAAAASAYNELVKEAIEDGRVEKVRRGKLRVLDTKEDTTMMWAIVNKETREIEGYAPSKNKAYAVKTDAQTVRKTRELA